MTDGGAGRDIELGQPRGRWFALLAVANIYVARNFPDNVWVNFKVFGISAAMLVFMIPQVIWLHGKIKPVASGAAPP